MKQETTDSLTSYGIGGAGITLSVVMEVAQWAQAIAMIVGCCVVIIRLIHDVRKLWKSWK